MSRASHHHSSRPRSKKPSERANPPLSQQSTPEVSVTTGRKPNATSSPYGVAAMLGLIAGWAVSKYDQHNPAIHLTGAIPEPFDVVAHISNATLTFLFIDSVSFVAHQSFRQNNEVAIRRYRAAHAAGVVATVVVMNIAAETVGYGRESTSDPIDFAYGVVGGAMAYGFTRPRLVTLQPETNGNS